MTNSEQEADWVFECTGCGQTWTNPPSPVTGHHCNRHPRARGIPEGDPADVVVIETPGDEDVE
jgi:hypothetical protein